MFLLKPKTRLNKSKKQKRVVVSTGVVSVKSGLAKKNKHDGKKTARNKVGFSITFLRVDLYIF